MKLIFRHCYEGEGDPGPPLTPDEFEQYAAAVDEIGRLWSALVDLLIVDALTFEEWGRALEKLAARSAALKPWRDRLAFEIDNSPSAIATDRDVAQINLGRKFYRGKREPKPTFRTQLERVFYRQAQKLAAAKLKNTGATVVKDRRRNDPDRVHLGEETDQD